MSDARGFLVAEEAIEECLRVAAAEGYARAVVRVQLRELTDNHRGQLLPPFRLLLLHPNEAPKDGDIVLSPAEGLELRFDPGAHGRLKGWELRFVKRTDGEGFHFENVALIADFVGKVGEFFGAPKAVP